MEGNVKKLQRSREIVTDQVGIELKTHTYIVIEKSVQAQESKNCR